jgi:hypothetical protein
MPRGKIPAPLISIDFYVFNLPTVQISNRQYLSKSFQQQKMCLSISWLTQQGVFIKQNCIANSPCVCPLEWLIHNLRGIRAGAAYGISHSGSFTHKMIFA